jgi:hypothetical protein
MRPIVPNKSGAQIFQAPALMDHLNWQSLLEKLLVTATLDSHYCTCLGHLGQHDINRNDPIKGCFK